MTDRLDAIEAALVWADEPLVVIDDHDLAHDLVEARFNAGILASEVRRLKDIFRRDMTAMLERAEQAESALAAERIENAHLREAFVTMERAANERETDLKDAFRQGMLAAEAICDDYGELPLGSMDEAWEASKWARREP